jgi:hypothetical protein
MTDHIEVLRRLIKRAGESADFTVSDAREADELLAALSAREGGDQHAEAGAVAWVDPTSLRNFQTLGHRGGEYGREWMWAKPEDGLVPVFLHPAQPASQQGAIGEIVARPYGYGVEWLVSPAPAIGTKLYASQQGEDKDLKAVLERALKENTESGTIPSVLTESTKIRLSRERVAILRALHRREECASGCPPQTGCDICQYRGVHPTGDRVRAVLDAADAWWRMKKPLAYSDAEHAANPVINCCTDSEKALAIAAAALDQEKGR